MLTLHYTTLEFKDPLWCSTKRPFLSRSKKASKHGAKCCTPFHTASLLSLSLASASLTFLPTSSVIWQIRCNESHASTWGPEQPTHMEQRKSKKKKLKSERMKGQIWATNSSLSTWFTHFCFSHIRSLKAYCNQLPRISQCYYEINNSHNNYWCIFHFIFFSQHTHVKNSSWVSLYEGVQTCAHTSNEEFNTFQVIIHYFITIQSYHFPNSPGLAYKMSGVNYSHRISAAKNC